MTLPLLKHSHSLRLNGFLAKSRSLALKDWLQFRPSNKPDAAKIRGARQPNEIDFWRGFALITIFIDHIPGIFFEAYTYRHFGISDAAELFVFLAGWSLRLVVRSQYQVFTFSRLLLHLGGRALLIYLTQILITTFALAITAAAALMLDAPNLLEWNNAAAAFQDPVPAHLGTVLLTYQLGFFDILPLYVVLMFSAPVIAIINHYTSWLLLPLSLTLYTLTLVSGFNLPTWPIEGRWFFNPMAWQFMFVLGFVLAEPGPIGKLIKAHPWVSRTIVLPILLIGIWIGWSEFEPDPLDMPAPHLFFTFDKTFLTPLRIIHLLSLIIMFGGMFAFLNHYLRPITRLLSTLGRNSLNVFCLGSLLSLIGQFVRYSADGNIGIDSLIIASGVVALSLAAWASEWRQRLRAP